MQTCKVCVLNTNRDFFDYQVPAQAAPIGTRVWVPFGKMTRLGIIINYSDSNCDFQKIKPIHSIIDATPLLSTELLALCQWMSSYYQAPLSAVIALAIPKKYRLGQECSLPTTIHYKLALPLIEAQTLLSKRALKQHACLTFLAQQEEAVTDDSLQQAGFNKTIYQALVSAQLISVEEKVNLPNPLHPHKSLPLPLNAEQEYAQQCIQQSLNQYRCFLLYGVTGSGKTEVYLQSIQQVLDAGKQVLVLVPEIGLTPQLLDRFRARFAIPILTLHSHLNDTERQTAWQFASHNQVQLIIGTRSAIFTPMPKLGLIIIDEEHDTSLKQMDGVRYSARDTALMRAYTANIPIILGSATPSLEALYNAQTNKYQLLTLKNKALNNNPLYYHMIDLRGKNLNAGLSDQAIELISEHLALNNQVLVFINRRGFAPVLLCHQCGWIADCHACDSHLTFHKENYRLVCHHCGANHAKFNQCKKCNSRELLPIGSGTQRVYEYLEQKFPDTPMLRIDRDETSKKNSLENNLNRIHSGEVQLIVGTQMLAKGHHFPRLTLVVILDTDSGLYNQDFRALEHLGQLLTQVAGRTGRDSLQGHVALQTHYPEHPLLNILIQQGYDPFTQELLELRKTAELPPYYFMAIIRAKSTKQENVLQFLHMIKEKHKTQEIQMYGPAPAPLSRKANEYRMQLLFKAASRRQLHAILLNIRQNTQQFKNVKWSIDVDPIDLA